MREEILSNRKKLFFLALILSGCSSNNIGNQPSKPEPLQATITFCAPHDDILRSALPLCSSGSQVVGGGDNVATDGPKSGRICNMTKNSCELGIVSNTLHFSVLKNDGENIDVVGYLDTQVGKTGDLTYAQGGYSSSVSNMIDDNVPLIPPSQKKFPFHQTVKLGDTIPLVGLIGSSTSLKIEKQEIWEYGKRVQ